MEIYYLFNQTIYIQISISGTPNENDRENSTRNMMKTNLLEFGRRHEDARKSSSSESSSPLLPGLSSGIPTAGIPGNFHGNFLPSSVIPGAPHLLPPPLLLMPSSGTPTSSPPISSSSPNTMQTSNKLLVKPHPHRFMPTSSHIPGMPLSSNPYYNLPDNLESYGMLIVIFVKLIAKIMNF